MQADAQAQLKSRAAGRFFIFREEKRGIFVQSILKELTALSGACGFEHDVARYLAARLKDSADEVRVDGLGNVIAMKRGGKPGPVLMISAHADEVGFIVKKIEKNGLLRFEKIGGHDDRTILNEGIYVRSQDGQMHYGIIGSIPCHMMRFDDPHKVRSYQEMYIDVGAQDAQGVCDMGIRVGDPITWATPYRPFGQNRAVGHAFDDRAGCAVLVKTLEETDFTNVCGSVYFVFSTQEEVGLRGARIAAQQIHADVGIAVDTTAVSDTFEAMMDNTLALGAGVGIKVMDHHCISSVPVRKKLEKLADEAGIPWQPEVFLGIGTDAGELYAGEGGVPVCTLSIPSRYAHCPHEVIDLGDLDACQKLLERFILTLRNKEEFAFI